ncbi:hypothetical protein D3H65_09390 [Paraflavitalea soli]|uniref:Uncharacterized protein n=1 Tax=Paraflavitalea soli TaxID=2315862 RepID=A0A3B7MRD6_9BACT|nr:hypothetical protein [Paraflavitalea soli]AXY74175.1 hypothetical protein D3H65_09390 [Paraflavitalea soli]
MNLHRLKELTAPFRRDAHCFLPGEQKYEDIFIRSYQSTDRTAAVAETAALRISDLPVIKQFILIFGYQHRDQHQKLLACLQQMNVLLAGQIKDGQANIPGNVLLVTLDNFQEVLSSFRRQVYSRFLWNLQAMEAESCCCGALYITTEEIDAVMTLMTYFKDELHRFYEEMDTVFYGGEKLVKNGEESMHLNELLANVLLLAERSILLEDDLLVGLAAWKKVLADREEQQLLN